MQTMSSFGIFMLRRAQLVVYCGVLAEDHNLSTLSKATRKQLHILYTILTDNYSSNTKTCT